MKVTVNIYPNNEIRTSIVPDPRYKKQSELNGKHETPSDEGVSFLLEKANDPSHEAPPILDISCDFRESLKPGYGGTPRKTVFGLRAKRTLQRVGGVFDKKFVKEHCLFLTGTLPGSTKESYEAIASWSGYIVDRLKSWVSYYVSTEFSFHVWELQRRGALHLHYCVAVHDGSSRQSIIERFKSEWVRILKSVSAKAGIDLFQRGFGGSWKDRTDAVQAYAQPVRKSVAAYLAKYCSKGHDTSQAFYCPSRWWGCSRAALHALEEMTLTIALDSLSLRKAQQIFEDVIHITEAIATKFYDYWHGSGFGRTQVVYHCPEDSSVDIWKSIINTFLSFSMTYLAKNTKANKSPPEISEILRLSSSRNSFADSFSVPLREILAKISSGSQTVEALTLTDWKELYSLICLLSSEICLPQRKLKLKRYALSQVRRLQTNEYCERLTTGKGFDADSQ